MGIEGLHPPNPSRGFTWSRKPRSGSLRQAPSAARGQLPLRIRVIRTVAPARRPPRVRACAVRAGGHGVDRLDLELVAAVFTLVRAGRDVTANRDRGSHRFLLGRQLIASQSARPLTRNYGLQRRCGHERSFPAVLEGLAGPPDLTASFGVDAGSASFLPLHKDLRSCFRGQAQRPNS